MPDHICHRPGCGKPIPPGKRRHARWCSRSCASKAARSAKLLGIELDDYGAQDELLPESVPTLAELYAATDGPELTEADLANGDPRQYSDFGELPGDVELAAEIDERDARFRKMLAADESRWRPRRSWFGLKQRYRANPGVELPEITSERVSRAKDGQARTRDRLRNSKGQPQDRHNPVTKDNVQLRATESRRLNRGFVTSDPRPVWQAEEFNFQGESWDGDLYRSGRAGGYRPNHANYAWNMRDGA